MNGITQIKARGNKQILWFAVRLLIGGALGAAAYLAIAKIVVDQPTMACSPKLARSIVEASTFPASMLVGEFVRPESIFYRPAIYGLSSIPYAVLGALLVLKSKARVIFVVGLVNVICLCSSLFAWGFLMAAICA